jgi:ubiquinone/menaquinone biosynthesis C-methylase UbiE
MKKHSNAKIIRSQILDEYYSNVYQNYLFSKDAQGLGTVFFENSIEKFWNIDSPSKVLEIGGGSGEHLKYLKYVPKESYVSFDLRPQFTDAHVGILSSEFLSKLRFVTGNAESLPFEEFEFDRVFMTCVLHHVDDVLSVLLEARRVSCKGAELVFAFPTDPGLLNQLVKKIISYPKLRKLSKVRPELFYALDHRNHVGSILEQIRYVFKDDKLTFHYSPFKLRSWNLNLFIVAKVTKS